MTINNCNKKQINRGTQEKPNLSTSWETDRGGKGKTQRLSGKKRTMLETLKMIIGGKHNLTPKFFKI